MFFVGNRFFFVGHQNGRGGGIKMLLVFDWADVVGIIFLLVTDTASWVGV